MVQIGINLQAGQDSLTDNFTRQAGYEYVADDTRRSLARQFQTSGGQPIFVIINGVANSPSHAQWELLLHQNGYGTSRHPIDLFRSVIDSVEAPAIAQPPPAQPPAITAQPQSRIASLGETATLSVTVEGTDPISFQWQFDGIDIVGATDSTLVLDNVQTADEGSYGVWISNSAGSVTSTAATVTVIVPPSISSQPQSQTVSAGSLVMFQVVASGSAPLSYQWLFNGIDIPGAVDAALNRNNIEPEATGNYTVVVSNAAGSTTSTAAELVIVVRPSISVQPQSRTVQAGADLTFQVVASGTVPLNYQWQLNGVDIPDAIGPSLNLNDVQLDAAGSYAVVVSNAAGSAMSTVVELTVTVPPSISVEPRSQSVSEGTLVTFQVVASGSDPLSYQWRFNGIDIPGAIGATLNRNNVQPEAAGDYTVVVSNAAGSTTSAGAELMIVVRPSISVQPQSRTVQAGADLTFQVVASGTVPLNYQWQLNGVDIPDAIGPSLNLNDVQLDAAGSYAVVVSNAAGSAMSTVVELTVTVPPSISVEPRSQSVSEGTLVTFQVVASGSDPLSYQWRFNGIDIPGAIGATLNRNNVRPEAAGDYTVIVSNAAGSTTSAGAELTIVVLPSISVQPRSQTVPAGTDVTFAVVATGSDLLSYRWRFNGVDIPGATAATLDLTNVQPGNDGSYSVHVTNFAGTATSAGAALIVNAATVNPLQIDRIELNGNIVTLEYRSAPTSEIVIESTDSLASGAWTILKTILPGTGPTTVRVSDTISVNRQRFYRLRIAD